MCGTVAVCVIFFKKKKPTCQDGTNFVRAKMPKKVLSEEEIGILVVQVRSAIKGLGDTDGYAVDDKMLVRYLRARNWDVDGAVAQLTETLQWRSEYKPLEITCTYCRDERLSTGNTASYHSWRQIGHDKAGRAVTYSCISQGRTSGLVPEDCVMHAVYLFENMVPSLTLDAETYVWILDFTGITM